MSGTDGIPNPGNLSTAERERLRMAYLAGYRRGYATCHDEGWDEGYGEGKDAAYEEFTAVRS